MNVRRSTVWKALATAAPAALLAWPVAAEATDGSQTPAGLRLVLEAGRHQDVRVVSNVWLYATRGASPSPLLPAGPFEATWTGTIAVDLRSDYRFQADLVGHFTLEINGTTVLEGTAAGGPTDWSPTVRLRKGTNSLRAVLSGDGSTDTGVRLRWRGRGVLPSPIPAVALGNARPAEDPEADRAARLRLGRHLFLQHRCARCHGVEVDTPVPELGLDAPSFDGIGNRRRAAWLARWIENPREHRPEARMPRVLTGAGAREEAEALAAWLSSLALPKTPPPDAPPGNAAAGRVLFEALACGGCHSAPSQPVEASKIALGAAGGKFAPGALAEFLARPGRHFTWTAMPDFGLSPREAADLAAWILADGPPPPGEDPRVPPGPTLIARGRELAQTRGCLKCHVGPAEDRFTAKPLRDLAPTRWNHGCLAEDPPESSPAPRYTFNASERAALREFGASDRASLGRHVPSEFAARWTEALRCDACHGPLEGVPRIAEAGAKLRPEWTTRLLRGEVKNKPRPWLQARMPAFPAYAEALATGAAAAQGLPPASPAEPAADPQAAEDGRRLVSASGGFACVTCHAIGRFGATAVFEAPGINLAYAGERLRPEYFARWVQNPQAIDPGTKMPLYFDEEGNSALADFHGGDGPKTIHALWEYVRLGAQMPPPPP